MIRDHLAPEQRGSHVVDVRDLRTPDEHVDLVAPMQGVLFALCASACGWLLLYLALHIGVALWRAHHL